MLIKNLKKSIVFLPPAAKGQKPRMLKPGVNEIEPAAWATAKEALSVQRMIEAELLVEEAGATEAGGEVNITDLSHAKAKKLIAETVDVDLLTKWSSELKGDLKKAVTHQLEKVQTDPKP